ncbi:MAG: Fur family transcriptional regulator [Bacillota bacterium]
MDKALLGLVRERMKKRSLRLTPQRVAVLEVLLQDSPGHLGADEIHARLRDTHPEVGLATVYRTLDMLESIRVVHKTDFGEGRSQFELNPRDEGHYHHHLICLDCGRIIEFQDDLLNQLEEEIARKAGFQVVDHTLRVYGYCRACRPKRREPGKE